MRMRIAVVVAALTAGLFVAPSPASATPAVNVNTVFVAVGAPSRSGGIGPASQTWSGTTVTVGSPLLASLGVAWTSWEGGCTGSYSARFTLDDHKGDTMSGSSACGESASSFAVAITTATGSYAGALGHTGTLAFTVQPSALTFLAGSLPLPLVGTLRVSA